MTTLRATVPFNADQLPQPAPTYTVIAYDELNARHSIQVRDLERARALAEAAWSHGAEYSAVLRPDGTTDCEYES